jgi:hypothetical protein
MPVDPKDFFQRYVLQSYDAWIRDELCEWKAMAVANALNALIEYKFLADNPARKVTDPDHAAALGNFWRGLPNWEDHRHIRFVAEIYKHVERRNPAEAPNSLADMAINEAGAFSRKFSRAFDVARDQLGFPFQATPGGPSTWVPLRTVATVCVEYWRGVL